MESNLDSSDQPVNTGSSIDDTRRHFLRNAAIAGAGAAISGFPAIVRAQTPQRFLRPIVAGLNGKPGDPTFNSISDISKILREKHNVQMDIQAHPSSTLGSDFSQLESVQTGFIDITSHTTAAFSGYSHAFDFIDLPYSINSWEMGLRVFKSDLWSKASAKFEQDRPLLKVLPAVGAGGFRLLWNKRRPLKSPSDLNGLKFRTSPSQIEIGLIKAWGGNPTPMAFTEVYSGLQNGVIDGIHNQPIWTYVFNIHEVLKYATAVGAYFTVQLQVMNRNTWNSMPPAIQKAFMAAAQEAADAANAQDRALESQYIQKIKDAKIEIYTPNTNEMKVWRSAGESLWDTVGKDVDRGFIKDLIALR